MTLNELVAELSARQVKLIANGDKLEVKAKPGALTPALVKSLKAFKPQLLALYGGGDKEADIAPIDPQTPVKASPAQRRLWFVDQLNGGTSLQYHMPSALVFKGRLNLEALRRAFRHLIERHQVLRTCFYPLEGEAYQRLLDADGFELSLVDVCELPGSQAQQIHQDERQRIHWAPFRLDRDYMLRAGLVRTAEQQYYLYLNLHHIAFDGWSEPIFVHELVRSYFSFDQGCDPGLAALPIQYRDYAAWCWHKLDSGEAEAHFDYWRHQLADLPQLHSLPLDKPRPVRLSAEADVVRATVAPALTARLNALAAAHETTLFTVLYALFAATVGRFGCQHDVVIGSPVSGREHRQLEGLIGFFVNTLVLRLDLSEVDSLASLLTQAKAVVLDGMAHQEVNFDMLVEALNPERAINHHPLYQLAFSLNKTALAGHWQGPDDLQMEKVAEGGYQAKFDVSLEIQEQADSLTLNWIYSKDLFEHQSVVDFNQTFMLLVHRWLDSPDLSLAQLDLLDGDSLERLNREFRFDRQDYPADLRLEVQVAETAKRVGDKIAVIDRDSPLSYHRLQQQVERVAAGLRRAGASAGSAVVVALQRSANVVATVLAVWRIGCFYVPLSLSAPAARNRDILSDCRPSLVVDDGREVPGLSAEIPRVDFAALLQDDPGGSVPQAGTTAEDIAYMIYTSGSTGKPKGVAVSHRSVSRLVVGNRAIPLDDKTVSLHISAPTFDASVFELWGALLNGGTLVIHPGEQIDCRRLSDEIRRHRVNTLLMTSALFDVWVESLDGPCRLRHVLSGGDVVSAKTVERLYRLDPQVKAYNVYGPTEDAVISTCFEVPRDWDWDKPLPIGRSVAQSCSYVMTSAGGLQPGTAAGELWLGGDGLAVGYFGDQAQTAKAFVGIDKHGVAVSRLYRSGDLVRRDRHGLLHYLARVDKQVKLRGFRIELAEIECRIRSHASVNNAVVTAVSNGPFKKLVGFVTFGGSSEPQARLIERLRKTLADELPDYMVPSAIVAVERLPLTAHGKVDTAILVEQAGPLFESARYHGPENELEGGLQQLWQTLLGVENVSVSDNFFELGGHSLLAMKLAARVEAELGLALPIDRLFRFPTIRQLAAALAEEGTAVKPPPLTAVERNGLIRASFAQQRLWFIDHLEGDSSNYHIPLALALDGPLNIKALSDALDKLLLHNEVLRTVFVLEQGVVYQQILPYQPLPLETVDVSGLPETRRDEALAELAQRTANAPFDLAKDRMVRVALARLSADSHRLYLTLHHIAADGWSVKVMLERLQLYYAQSCRQQIDEAAAEWLQYADYAHWQRQWLQGDVLQGQLDYWQRQLADLPVVHQLPLDRVRPQRQSFCGRYHRQTMSGAQSDRLKSLAQRHNVSLFMLMQAAFSLLVGRLSGQTDVAIGTPSANRLQPETETMLGLFVNTLVLRADLSGEPDFAELLSQVRQTHIDAQAHQHVPFEMIVEALNPPRRLEHSPLFQLLFTMQQAEASQHTASELKFALIEQDYDVAKFDLAVTVVEHADGLNVQWQYNTDLFDLDTVAAMAKAYQVLLGAVIEDIHCPVSRLPLLDEADRAQMLGQSDKSRVEYPADLSLHQMIGAQARATPEAVALVCGEQTLSYGELERQSNRLARYIIAAGGQGRPIGLYFDRCPQILVAMLGAMKAGSPYLPVALGTAVERLDYMLEDADAAMLLSRTGLFEGGVRVAVNLDDPEVLGALQGLPDKPLDLAYSLDDLAYILYTSGSTGNPKGVLIGHAGVANLAWAMRDILADNGLSGHYRWGWNAAYVFDASVQALTQLAFGAELHLLDEQLRLEPLALVEYCRQQHIDVIDITPSLLRLVLATSETSMQGLPSLLVGGEAIDSRLWQLICDYNRRFDTFALNLYGPTECTVNASWTRIEPDTSPHLGQPMANLQLLVLGPDGQLQPHCGIGELCIAGTGLSKGYLKLPEQTARQFVDHPYLKGERLYRTGDLVRRCGSGRLLYIGRIDQQIKYRGYRIELTEIEARMMSGGWLDACAASVRRSDSSEQLVGYYVRQAEAPEDLAQRLKALLESKLPGYMVPSLFVEVEQIPLSTSGKVKRDALDSLALPERVREHSLTSMENRVQGLLQQVLGWTDVNFSQSFFENGGHSLSAVLFVQAIRQSLGIGFELRRLYRNEPLSVICEALAQVDQREWPLPPHLLPLHCTDRAERWVFMHGLSGLPGVYQPLFDTLDDKVDTYALQLDRSTMIDLKTLVRDYAESLMNWNDDKGMTLIGWSAGGVLAQALTSELDRRGFKHLRLVMLDAFAPTILNTHRALMLSQLQAEQRLFMTLPQFDDPAARRWLDEVPPLLSAMAQSCDDEAPAVPTLLLQAGENPMTVADNGWTPTPHWSCETLAFDHQQLLSEAAAGDIVCRIIRWSSLQITRS